MAHQGNLRTDNLLQQSLAGRTRQSGAGHRLTLQDGPEQCRRFHGAQPWAMVQSVEVYPQPLQPLHGLREALTSLRSQRPLSVDAESTLGGGNAMTDQEEFHVCP